MNAFHPSIWPEEPVPGCAEGCDQCGLAEHGTRMVWGEGNPDAPIMVVLDNPGAREDKNDEPYVCSTRQALQEAVNAVGLQQDDLYVTYVLKRRPTRKYDKPKTREICMRHLEYQLESKQPDYVMCLGNVAVQSFFDDEEAEVKKLRGRMYKVKGIDTTVAYHPLAVRRRPNLWNKFREDCQFIADQFFEKRESF